MCLCHWFGIENLFCGLVDIETTRAGSDVDSLILQSDDKNVPESQKKYYNSYQHLLSLVNEKTNNFYYISFDGVQIHEKNQAIFNFENKNIRTSQGI